MRMGGCWVIDLDVRKFFDTMDHAYLRTILAKRMRDGVVTRLIGKWLLPERSGNSHYGPPANMGTWAP